MIEFTCLKELMLTKLMVCVSVYDLHYWYFLIWYFHYWYFPNASFKFQPEACSGFHDLMQKAMNFNDIAIGTVK